MIDDVSISAIGKEDKIQWVVDVKPGSANIIATPISNNGSLDIVTIAVNAIESGIVSIEESSQRPEHFSDSALRKIYELATIADPKDSGLTDVNILFNQNRRLISKHTAANIDKIMGVKYHDYGSVEGKLRVISERKSLRFFVVDDFTGKSILCYFKEENVDDVLSAFRKRVSVYGLIMYKSHGEPYSLKVEQFRVFKDKEDLPTANDVLEILKKDG